MNGPQAGLLDDGRLLHLNHGPIDLILEAFGEAAEVRAAHGQATARFQTILGELVEELPDLRSASSSRPRVFRGPTAQRMETAVSPLAGENFITPMAAVAGSVADEILAAMIDGRQLDKAYVNNGGDSALFLAPGQSIRLAIAGTGKGFADRIVIHAEDAVRGVATSGWRGRSFSLGVADAVTVLARTGGEADAAATVIANAVDLPAHPAIRREPARALAPDSDLGDRLVTTDVGVLSEDEVAEALENGLAAAEKLRRRGLIEAAALFLNGEVRVCGIETAENAPSTTRSLSSGLPKARPGGVVPLPRFAGEDPGSRPSPTHILPRLRGRGTAPRDRPKAGPRTGSGGGGGVYSYGRNTVGGNHG